jgi:hypothetical protein
VIETFLLPLGRESQKFIFAFYPTIDAGGWEARLHEGVPQHNLLHGARRMAFKGFATGKKGEKRKQRGSAWRSVSPKRTEPLLSMQQKEGRKEG